MNSKQILQDSIVAHQQAIDKAQAELKALDKPKLRHGDYGFGHIAGDPRLIAGSDPCIYGVSGSPNTASNFDIKLGNIFDDLAAIAEPLEEFKTKERRSFYSITCKVRNDDFIRMEDTNGDSIEISCDDLHDFILNLRRLENTLKKRLDK